jgi:hypothetical protein
MNAGETPKNPATGGGPGKGGYRFAPAARTPSPGAEPVESEKNNAQATTPAPLEEPASPADDSPVVEAPKPEAPRAPMLTPVRLKQKTTPKPVSSRRPTEPAPQGKAAEKHPESSEENERVIDPQTPSDFLDREERISCSLPGLLKILIPERSFIPTSVAVRVANISVSGAMVEIHDRQKLAEDAGLANRYFELKVAHPEIPFLRGTVAWADLNRKSPLLGLSSFDRFTELGSVLKRQMTVEEVQAPAPLEAPKLDPYPPKWGDVLYTLTGEAPPDAETVSAKGDTTRFEAKVENGRFRLEIELEAGRENHFSLRAHAGSRRSRATPVRMTPITGRSSFRCEAVQAGKPGGSHTIALDFNGNVRQAERILFRLSQLMALSDTVTMTMKLHSRTEFDKRLFEALQSESAVLASDTDGNPAIAKLLDDLF